jgi:microcystin-dependent protein/sulfur transfer complex TusBCD TusB component (DsrH family)
VFQPCANCIPADIILCLDPETIAPRPCLNDEDEETTYEFHTIDATLTGYSYVPDNCGAPYYKYTISYDDSQLVDLTLLLQEDILGIICKSCLTHYIDDKAGYAVSIVTTEEGQTLVNQYGCEYPIVSDGGEGVPNAAIDTNSINLSLSGTLNRTIQADLIVSADPGNALVILGNGVYAAAAVANAAVDTNSINLTLSGTNNSTIQADAIISPTAGNTLSTLANGLYVPTETSNAGIDTLSIDLTLSGTANRTIQADLIISPDPGNTLVLLGNGVYVPTPSTDEPNTATDTNSVDLTLSGTLDRNIQADVKISADGGNAISIVGDGLYAALISGTEPPGVIHPYAGTVAPAGYLMCQGAAVSRVTYAALFAVTGVAFGPGDGVTTFNLPDARGRFLPGVAAAGTASVLGETGGALDHTHNAPAHYHALGTGADLAIASSGSHLHTINHTHPATATGAGSPHNHSINDPQHNHTQNVSTTASGGGTATRADYDADVVNGAQFSQGISTGNNLTGITINSESTHTHVLTLPAYTGDSGSSSHTHSTANFSGRVGLVTGGVDGNAAMATTSANPAYLAVNYIIKT